MDKLWTGRFKSGLDESANDFNSSVRFDSRMYRQDIDGSVAHATMLKACGIISGGDADRIVETLNLIKNEIDAGTLEIDPAAEDIHSFVEGELTRRLGDTGKRLHTARSRNDQVATDLRLYLINAVGELRGKLEKLADVISEKAEQYIDTVMPGYTHMQRAQPVTFGQHLLAYRQMLLRDMDRLDDWEKRAAVSPLGCCALAGTTYPTDRCLTAKLLGFSSPCENTLDGVSDRDFAVELAAALSLIMMHLSRFSEEIILWCSWEFKFIELDDSFSTGSSIMPQKKNPDIAELVRGKTGRVYGDLMTLLTMLKGLPLAYNKDMQEDKEAIFDALDTVSLCLGVFAPMLSTMRVNADRMRQAAAGGFINATDCADYLVGKGLPFRTAYKTVGQLVAFCIDGGMTLETLPLESYRSFSPLFDDDIYAVIDLDACVARRRKQD